MKITIKSWFTGSILFETEAVSIKGCLEIATGNCADARGADLRGAYLRGADLTPIKHDFWVVLVCAVKEIPFLRKALIEWKVNGSQYSGECACLVGTIANAKKCSYEVIKILQPDSSRPAERFFLAIKEGDTPENSEFSKLAVEWLDEFVANVGIKI